MSKIENLKKYCQDMLDALSELRLDVVNDTNEGICAFEFALNIEGEIVTFWAEIAPCHDDIYPVQCTTLPGVVSQGKSKEDAFNKIIVAIIESIFVRSLTNMQYKMEFPVSYIPVDEFMLQVPYKTQDELCQNLKTYGWVEYEFLIEHRIFVSESKHNVTITVPQGLVNQFTYYEIENLM